MKNYSRLMLGQKSVYATECFAGGFVGTNFGLHEDLTGKLPENWRDFNKAYIPKFLYANPEKSKIAAGLACGAIWTVSKGLNQGDVVLCPDGVAEKDQKVESLIIALEDNQKLKWALAAVDNISFYRYEVSFKLIKS